MRRGTLALIVALTGCSKPAEKGTAPTAPPAKPPSASIAQFYLSPPAVGKGGRSLLCYGVEAAAQVRLEPPVEEITPALARCIEVKAAATTTYKLIATNRAGEEVSQSVTLTVDPKLAAGGPAATGQGGLILFFTAVQGKVPKGLPATLCYGVKGVASVSLTPNVQTLAPSERLCFQVRPEATTSYVLTAVSADGKKDTETVKIAVE